MRQKIGHTCSTFLICRDYRDIFVTEPLQEKLPVAEQGEYRQQTQRHDRPSGGFLEGWCSSRHNVVASPHAIHLKYILDFGEGQVNLGDDCRRSLQQGFGRQVTLLTNTKSQGSPSDLEGGARNLRIGLSSADFEYNMRTSLGGKILMRHIDIDSLSEDELIELNHKVVARLRFLSQMRSHSAMLDFRVGERVK